MQSDATTGFGLVGTLGRDRVEGQSRRIGARWARGANRVWTVSRKGLGAVIAAAALPVLLLALWHLTAQRQWVSSLILPPPSEVWRTFRELLSDGTIAGNLGISAMRVAKGFAAGGMLGLGLGTALGLSASCRAYLQPTFISLTQVNILGWIPLLILVFGIDEPLKLAAIAWATFLPVTFNTMQGIAGIAPKWFELARVYQVRPRDVICKVALPAALPSLFTGIRSGLGAAWMSLVLVELVASSEGIGFMVVWGRQLFQLDLVFVAIIVIGVVGLALDGLLRAVEWRLRRWHGALA